MVAGLANLPMVVLHHAVAPARSGNCWPAATAPHRLRGRRGALAGLAWAVEVGYWAIALFMVTQMPNGRRTVMTICAVALVDATPASRLDQHRAQRHRPEIGDEEDTEPAPQPAG
ncbi:MAG: hypothetical protein R2742_15075 [Micropruina glycogenica]